MSYDAYLALDAGNDELINVHDCGNYTWNCGTMLFKALKLSLTDMNNFQAETVSILLKIALKEMSENREEYLKLNPPNGWGNLEGWMEYLNNIRMACEKYPKCIFKVC